MFTKTPKRVKKIIFLNENFKLINFNKIHIIFSSEKDQIIKEYTCVFFFLLLFKVG